MLASKIRRWLFITLFTIVFIGIALYYINKYNVLGLCDVNSPLMAPSSNWKISSSTFDAEILWQSTEAGSLSPLDILYPYSLAFSDVNVLYGQDKGKEFCDVNPVVVAYDRLTGHEQWRFRPDRYNPKLFAASTGYVLVNPFSILMLDFQGNLLWQYRDEDTQLDVRSIDEMYESDGYLYFDSYEEWYKVSLRTGEVVETLNENILGIFDGYAVIGIGQNYAKLVSLNNLQQPIYTLEFPVSWFRFGINSFFPLVEIKGNYLLFNFVTYDNPHNWKIEAYRFDTGEKLWHVEMPFFYGLPVIFEDSSVAVIYTAGDKLEVRAIDTGELMGEIVLTRENANAISNPTPLTAIIVDGDDDTLFIRRSDTLELITLHINFAD